MSGVARPVDPDSVIAVVLACPYVAGISAGVLGEVATYLPGRRVRGLRMSADGVEVRVVGVYGPSIEQIVEQVRAAVLPLVAGQPLTVYVDDLADPMDAPVRSGGSAQPPRRGFPRA